MADHTDIRLEKSGTVVAYFAPNAEAVGVADNTLEPSGGAALPGDSPARIRDFQKITDEVTVQGVFMPTHDPDTGQQNLPDAHVSDLETVFGKSPVTAKDQVNRIRHYIHTEGGPFELFDGPDEYTASSGTGVDWQNGVFPVVQVKQLRPTSVGGLRRIEYTMKLEVGTPRG